MAEKGTSNRRFGSMHPEKQRDIGSSGGHAAHQKGAAHEFSSEEAQKAGRTGGETVSSDREHMSEIGRKGGERSHEGHSTQEHQSQGEHSDQRNEQRDNDDKTRGGSSEQHSQAGRQSHKKLINNL